MPSVFTPASEADVSAAVAEALNIQAAAEILTEDPGLLCFAEIAPEIDGSGRTTAVTLADGAVYLVTVERM